MKVYDSDADAWLEETVDSLAARSIRDLKRLGYHAMARFKACPYSPARIDRSKQIPAGTLIRLNPRLIE